MFRLRYSNYKLVAALSIFTLSLTAWTYLDWRQHAAFSEATAEQIQLLNVPETSIAASDAKLLAPEQSVLESNENPYRQVPCKAEQCADCANRVSAAADAVFREISKVWHPAPNCDSTSAVNRSTCRACKPRLVKIRCVKTRSSAYPCSRDFVIEEYDYATQHDRLSQIALSAAVGSNNKVARIAHSIYFYNGTRMQFHEYLSILSLVRHAKPALFFFWNDALPSGRWWIEMLTRLHSANRTAAIGTKEADGNQSLRFFSIVRAKPASIYGNAIWNGDQQGDVVRIEALLLFGGVYLDLDAFVIRDLAEFSNYSWVMGYERLKQDASWGWLANMDLLNNGVLLGERNASFALLWHHTYTSFFGGEQYAQHSIVLPHSLAESCPHLIHREPRSFNFPNNVNPQLLYGDGVYFDLSRNFVVHSWISMNKRLVSPSTIARMNTTMGRVWRYLYHASASL